jgi:hypothetical protein
MDLKLIVASTPKTGNTWLRHLLSEAYELPMVALPAVFSEETVTSLGPRWVSQEHYYPDERLISWAERESAVFLTTIRHPGDVLVSLYHYIRSGAAGSAEVGLVNVMRFDHEAPGANVIDFVRRYFYFHLHLSIAWMATGRSILVRYEDLCDGPEAELARIMHEVRARRPRSPLPLERVPGSVAGCDLDMLRQTPGLDKRFFRKGGSGGWADELPPELIEMFRTLPPYPAQFRALGYDPDPAHAKRREARPARLLENPFAVRDRFDDGVKVSSFLVRRWLTFDEAQRGRLAPTAGRSDPSSYLAWLGAPAEKDPNQDGLPLVTNLAAYIHSARIDLQAEYPDPFGRNRADFAAWFLRSAADEYALDPVLVVPMRDSYVAWANAPAKGWRAGDGEPLMTNLAAAIHASRPDLQAAFPALHGPVLIEFLIWFLSGAPSEHRLDHRVVEPVQRSFAEWSARAVDGTSLTNLARHIHWRAPWLQETFPDIAGADREHYVQWFETEGQLEISTNRVLDVSPSAGFVEWATAAAAEDAHPGQGVRITNLMLAIYRRRPDLQQAMPDIFGHDRLQFVRCIIQKGEAERGLSRAYLAPLFESTCTLMSADGVSRVPASTDMKAGEPDQ